MEKGSEDIRLTDFSETIPVNGHNISDYILSKAMKDTEGNCARIASVMKKAKSGQKIVIAAIGGSITQGSGANSTASCYVSRIWDYFKVLFPQTEIQLVNAGIGATSSAIGVYRLHDDVLAYDPDLVIVEYACNDANKYVGFNHKTTYENIVRECLKSGSAVLQLCVPGRVSGSSISDGALSEEKQVGKHYNVPVISVTDVLRPGFKDGTVIGSDYSKDGTHPHEEGHKLVAKIVTAYFDSVYASLDENHTDTAIPAPLTNDLFAGADFYSNKDIIPTSIGDFKNDSTGFQFKDAWLYTGGTSGITQAPPIVFDLKGCKTASLVFLVTPTGSGYSDGRVVVEVEGIVKEYELEADIETWGKYACTVLLYKSEDGKARDVKISIYPGHKKFSVLRVGRS